LIKNPFPVFLFLFVLLAVNLEANETIDGYIKMLINEKTGRFSLSFLTDTEKTKYTDLFYGSGKTSFFDININGVSYRLGESRVFTTTVESENDEPVVIYDSDLLSVKLSFTPIKTISSPNANGIRITIKIMNKGEDEPDVGLRMVLDTSLGEGRKKTPFVTENYHILKEKIIKSSTDEKYWISRGKDIALMGSINDPFDNTSKKPDYLHFANWKKLSDVPWKAKYHQGRSFNNLPYSVGDSAVSYYWEPRALGIRKTFTFFVYLTTEDTAWYQQGYYAQPVKTAAPEPAVVVAPSPQEQAYSPDYNIAVIEKEAQETALNSGEDYNVQMLKLLKNTLNQFIAGEITLSEHDILQIEHAIERYTPKKE